MKKLTALLMSIVMLTGLIVGTSASGEILWYEDFSNGFTSDNWITEGNLFFLDDVTDPDNPCLAAYSDGVISQSQCMYDLTPTPRGFASFVMSARVNLRDYDNDGTHKVGLWWIDDYHYISKADGGDDDTESGAMYQFNYNDTKEFVTLLRDGENVGRVSMKLNVGADEWFTMGWRIVPGRITCYINGVQVIEYCADDIVAEGNSPLMLYNSKFHVAFDDIIVATPDYDLFDETAMTFAVEADDVRIGDTTVNADIVVTLPDDATGYELGAFRVDLDYDRSVMSLAAAPEWKVDGLSISGDKLTTAPYPLAWATVDTPVFKAGKTVIASVTFNLTKPAAENDTYEIGLSIDRAAKTGNLPVSLASQDGTYTEVTYIRDQIALLSVTVGVHKYTAVVTEPTCANKGYTTYTCECGDTYVDNYVDELGHSYTDVVTPPTRTEQGYTTHTCGTCGDVYVDSYVDPIAVIPGDVNDDGSVSLADVTLLLKHLAGWDVTINADAADVNADEVVSLADATLLMKYLASWDVVLK